MTREEAKHYLVALKDPFLILESIGLTNDLREAIDMAIEALTERKTGKWIPCSERLPEDDVEVFIYLFERSAPYIAWVEDCRWYTEDFEVKKENYPTAWMPLPEPYRDVPDTNVGKMEKSE